MKISAATLVAIALLAGASGANARPVDSVFTDLGTVAPRSYFDALRDSSPRSPFDALNETAPRSIFDDIRDSAPRSTNDGSVRVDHIGE